MREFLNNIRTPNRKVPLRQAIFHTLLNACLGLFSGATSKLLDIYTSNLGNIFSQMSVWIFLCTVISVACSSPLRASVNVFLFCIGMLTAYYITAELTSSIYSMSFVYGWALFSLFTPVFSFFAWYSKGNKPISKMICVGIILVIPIAAVIFFDRIRIADIIFTVLTGIVLLK